MEQRIQEAKALKAEGKSYQQIADALGVSKSTAVNWCKKQAKPVEKSWMNPRWETDEGDYKPVDLYGAIANPGPADLISMNTDTVFACTTWIANSVASNPYKLCVKQLPGQPIAKCLTAPIDRLRTKGLQLIRKAGGDVREVVDHASVDLLERPNPKMSRYDYLYYVDTMLSLCGEAFALKQKENYKRISNKEYVNEGLLTYLYPLQNEYVTMQIENGKVIGYTYGTNEPEFFKPCDIVHYKWINPNNPYTSGYGPVRASYERILLQKNELAYLLSLYRNQARPDSVILLKGGAGADQCERVQKEMEMRFRQGGIGGCWVIDGEDFEIKNLNWSPKDLLGDALYKWTKLQIINAFELNEAIFSTESSNRAVATQAERSAQKRAIEPRLRLIEEKTNSDILSEFDDRLVMEFESPVEKDEDFDLQKNTQNTDRLFAIQQAVYQNAIPREAGIQSVSTLLDISEQEASKYFPQITKSFILKTKDDKGHNHDESGKFSSSDSGSKKEDDKKEEPKKEEKKEDKPDEKAVAGTLEKLKQKATAAARKVGQLVGNHYTDVLDTAEEFTRNQLSHSFQDLTGSPVSLHLALKIASIAIAKLFEFLKQKLAKAFPIAAHSVEALQLMISIYYEALGVNKEPPSIQDLHEYLKGTEDTNESQN